MATIPSFKQNNRISGPSGAAVNPNDARARGEGLARLGNSVQKFAGDIGSYMDAKKKVDLSLYEADILTNGSLEAQKAETFARTNPQAAADGSTTQNDFGQVFGEYRKRVEQEQDPQKRAVGLKALQSVESQARQRLVNFQVDKHNNFVLEKSSDILNGMSLELQQNPEMISEKLQQFDAMAANMPFTGKSKNNFNQTGRKQLVTSAIESFAYKGDFQTAKKLLNETEAGALYSIDERKKLTKELDDRRIKKLTDGYKLDQQQRTKMKQEREDRKEQILNKLYTDAVNAKTPQEIQEIKENADAATANGLMDPRARRALEVDQSGVNQKQSYELRGQHSMSHLRGVPAAQMQSKVLTDMQEGRLSWVDGNAILREIKLQVDKETTDPTYKAEKEVSKKIISSAVDSSGLLSALQGGSSRMVADMTERAYKYESEGMRPVEAAKLARAEVMGVQDFGADSTLDAHVINGDVGKLTELENQVKMNFQRLMSEGKSTAKTKKDAANRIREIRARVRYLQEKRTLEELTRGRSNAK